MTDRRDPDAVLDVLGDEHARRILALASDQAMSAPALADECGVSEPTAYRRVNDLLDVGLLREDTRIDADGNHYRTFETRVDAIEVAVQDGDLGVAVETDRDLVDRFDALWGDIGGDDA